MALQGTAAGEKLVFKFGDGGGPEVFTASCSINTDRSLDLSSDVYSAQLADCANPSNPKQTTRRVKALDLKFTGAGLADPDSFKDLLALWKLGATFNGKVIQDLDAGLGWTISGPWVIESLKIGGMANEDQTFDISLAIAGEFTITYN